MAYNTAIGANSSGFSVNQHPEPRQAERASQRMNTMEVISMSVGTPLGVCRLETSVSNFAIITFILVLAFSWQRYVSPIFARR